MARMLNAITAFFDHREWPYEADPEGRFVRLAFDGKSGTLQAFAQPREAEEQIAFYTLSPNPVPESRRQAMAELLTRLNWTAVLGNFEMDFEDGEVRFKASIDLEGSEATHALLHPITIVSLAMMDRYLPAIEAVIGGVEPVTAIAAVHGVR